MNYARLSQKESPMPLSTKTVLNTIGGESVVAKNWVHAFGMRRPITLAVIALVAGNVLGAWLHI